MLKKYLQRYAECSTENQINMFHIGLENRMTPNDLYTLFHQMTSQPSRFNKYQLDWVIKLYTMYKKSGTNIPQKYELQYIKPSVNIYCQNKIPKASKTLIICYTGKLQRMMMSTPVFLQHIDANENDIALIYYPRGKGYSNGIEDIGKDLWGTMENLCNLLNTKSYKRIVSMGCSAGAVPALLMALKYNFSSCIMAAPPNPKSIDTWWSDVLKPNFSSVVKSLALSADNHTELFSLFTDTYEIDKNSALKYQELFSAEPIEVKSNEEIKVHPHVVLSMLMLKGELYNTIRNILHNK